jgi:hypothetical protein
MRRQQRQRPRQALQATKEGVKQAHLEPANELGKVCERLLRRQEAQVVVR